MKLLYIGITDLPSLVRGRDTAVVLPTFKHSIYWWPKIQEYMQTYDHKTIRTKTSIVFPRIHRVLRLWIPYQREPTMPLDFWQNRQSFLLVDLYGMMGGRIYA